MDVERAQLWHVPHHLWQHAEGHYHLQVGIVGTQLGNKVGILHLLRLQNGQTLALGIHLDSGGLQHRAVPPHGLVWLGHHSHHVVAVVNECFQRGHGKLGRAHEDYA